MNGGEITASRRLKKKTKNVSQYVRNWTHLETVRNHLATNGIVSRIHSNVKRLPRWKTKITIDITIATAVKNFLENYAEIHGLPSPGKNVNRITQSFTLLPAETSYKSVYRNFIAGLENNSTPRTDLCDTCQHFRNGLQYNARKEEAKDLLKRYKEHLVKLIIVALMLLLIIVTIEHKMFTYPIPINSPRKVHLFGIQDEAVGEQINYVLDEDEIIGKGPNGTLSMVFDGIKKLNRGEKHLKITCDNAGGQNKINATI
ncbi:hypothetical protein G9A89_012862 [Geosiphon pyriformis]|nr:hypothetical protein G9A89_012862 [Geosiphon pyriformis]